MRRAQQALSLDNGLRCQYPAQHSRTRTASNETRSRKACGFCICEMRLIPLNGKHATGHFSNARVDDEDFAYLSQWRWKAKPNGGGTLIYAVRNTLVDGINKTVRMHREVLGLSFSDPHDTDHKDHDTVNNCRSNLEKVSRSENCRRQRVVVLSGQCGHCESEYHLFVPIGARHQRAYCSDKCAELAAKERSVGEPIGSHQCWACGVEFVPEIRGQQYCSKRCNDKGARPSFSKVYFNKCVWCKTPYVARRAVQLYCSKQCCGRSRYA